MTGYTVHTGSSVTFSAAWDRIFPEDAKGSSTGAAKKSGASQKPAVAKAGAAQARRRAKGKAKRS